MKVAELKEILEDALHDLEEYDDDKEVRLVSNTYFLGDCYCFLGISGYDGGYVNLNNPVEEDEDEEDEDDE